MLEAGGKHYSDCSAVYLRMKLKPILHFHWTVWYDDKTQCKLPAAIKKSHCSRLIAKEESCELFGKRPRRSLLSLSPTFILIKTFCGCTQCKKNNRKTLFTGGVSLLQWMEQLQTGGLLGEGEELAVLSNEGVWGLGQAWPAVCGGGFCNCCRHGSSPIEARV